MRKKELLAKEDYLRFEVIKLFHENWVFEYAVRGCKKCVFDEIQIEQASDFLL